MLHRMDLGDVEVGSNVLFDKLVLVCMKAVPCIFKPLEGTVHVGLEVSVVYEIEDSTGCPHNLRICGVGDDTKKDFLHVLVFVSSPLRDERYPLLEMVIPYDYRKWSNTFFQCSDLRTDLRMSL